MRLYIPTSSLNADNILSCESIAPAYACRKRDFGYSHFDILPELELFNKVTLAFSKIPTFHTSDTDRESFAMIVAIDVDNLEKFNIRHLKSINGVEVFATSSPITITPSTAQLIFFDKRAKEYTLHSCADSAKCKLFNFYKSNFCLADSRIYGESLRVYVEKIDVPDIESLYSENSFNKAKGFIWGYGIGTMLSISNDAAKLLKIQKRIYDIVSSTKNENCIPAPLADELSRLDNEFSSIDPNQKAIKTAWGKYLKEIAGRCLRTELDVANINEFLKELGAENVVKNKFLTDNRFAIRKKLSEYTKIGNYGYESYNHDVADYTERLINNERAKIAAEPFSQFLDVDTASYDTVMMSSDDRVSMLFNKILNAIIWNNVVPSLEELRVNKSNVAKNVVIAIKQIIEGSGEQWVNTPIQFYFNAMRKNITEFTEFNLNEINDVVLQSVAAFLLKGEDFNSLKQYLEANALSDYRYAFALWGAISGYVSIPRSIIESEITIPNTAHVFSEAQIALNQNSIINVTLTNTSQRETPSSVPDATSNRKNISFRDSVLAHFEKIKKGKQNQSQMKEELLSALNQLGDSDNSFLFICTLNDFSKWRKTSKAWQEMQAKFCPDYAEQTRARESLTAQSTLKSAQQKGFLDKLGGLFQHSDNGDSQTSSRSTQESRFSINYGFEFNLQNIECIVSLIYHTNPALTEFALKQIRKDLLWVFDPQYSSGKSQRELIETFRGILLSGKNEPLSKNGRDMKWKNDAYRCLNIEKTICKIKDSIS